MLFTRQFLLGLPFILLFHVGGHSQSSHFTTSDYWKTQKKELIFGIGASNFLGDLGGLDKVGTHFSPLDMEWNVTRPSGHVGYRYRFRPYFATKSFLQYAILKGDDALTSEPFRRNRNLSFRSHILEFSQTLEIIFFNFESFGKRYKIPGIKGVRNKNTVAYVFGGISGFLYVPQGPGGGGWTNLRPLKTEGQGLPGASKDKAYGLFSLGLPVGVGFKFGLDQLWRMSVELSYTQTFTDYLDDVSGTYYDNDAIRENYGGTAAYFADPSNGEFPTWTHEGELRGDSSHNDGYIFLNVSFVRNITVKRSRKIKWASGSRAVF